VVVIVTGEIGIGKTTVCRKVIQMARSRGYSCGGVITYKEPDGCITIEDVQTGQKEKLASTETIYDGPSTKKYFFNPIGIEFGIRAIEQGSTADILFVDELGHLELRGEGFPNVINLVSTSKIQNLVVVIRKALLEFFLPGLGSPLIFETTCENRGDLPEKIWSSLSCLRPKRSAGK